MRAWLRTSEHVGELIERDRARDRVVDRDLFQNRRDERLRIVAVAVVLDDRIAGEVDVETDRLRRVAHLLVVAIERALERVPDAELAAAAAVVREDVGHLLL